MTRRPTAHAMASRIACLLALSSAACTASAVEVAPPRYDLYFPTGMAVSPDERFLFVVNANSDLRYSHGTLQVLDLAQIDLLVDGWARGEAGPGCVALPSRPQVLGCPLTLESGEPAPAAVAGGSVGIGSFGVAVGVQPLLAGGAPSSTLRVFATVRGDPSVTWADFDAAAGTMSCGAGDGVARCDPAHRLARWRNDVNLPALPPEPFNLFVDAWNQHVFVTHFTSGYVSLISAPLEVGSEPLIQDTITSLFERSRVTGRLGAAGVASRLPGDPGGLVYVTSKEEARVATISVSEGTPDELGRPTQRLVRGGTFLMNGLEQPGLQGDARTLVFSPDGDRAFIVSRSPPSLELYDTSIGPTGAPRNEWIGAIELCEQAANVALADFGSGPRVAVPCFLNGQAWIVDPVTFRLLAVEESGRGPSGVAVAAGRRRIYIGNYAEDTISVIDAAPGSPRHNRLVLKLGRPRLLEERN
jgi:DNA-binding beta-propeller fold protein YncE